MEYKDPTKVSPDNYRLLLEDGDYRMVEMSLPAGTSDIEHSHPNEMVYFITGGKARIHLTDGKFVELEIPDGHVMKHEPWAHRVENIGATHIKAVLFERK
jgi:mannose-6-phosphate isomerase-like protein (cupin superfamily)